MNLEKKFPTTALGITVRVPIPEVDKEQDDLCNTLAVVISVTEDGIYRFGTSEGILKQVYERSQFILCLRTCLKLKIFLSLKFFSVQLQLLVQIEAAEDSSNVCVKQCQNVKCLCKSNLMKCNPKCYLNQPCCNKVG